MRNAAWRQRPASPSQVELVSKRWSKLHPGMEEEKRTKMLETLTKGNAADIITRLKHGSQVNLPTDNDEQYINTITKGAL
jgi:ATP-dependent helicase IRC3